MDNYRSSYDNKNQMGRMSHFKNMFNSMRFKRAACVLNGIFSRDGPLLIFAALGSICSESCAAAPSGLCITPSGGHSISRSSGEHCRDLRMGFALLVGSDERIILFR